MAENKNFNVRIVNKNDTFSNWESSTVILKKGEIALASVDVPKNSDNPDSPTLYVPTYLMKIGDNEHTFAELPWLHALAADVYEWAKKENPTIDELPANLQTAIKNLQSAVGDGGSVAETIQNAINALDVEDEAVVNQFVTAVSETDGKISVTRRALAANDIPELGIDKITGLQTALDAKLKISVFEEFNTSNTEAIADAKKAGTDAAAALNEYKTTNDAVVNENKSKVDTLIGSDTNKSVRTIANEELVAQLISENANESLDTLTEIATWIQEHPDDASAMNAAIVKLEEILDGIGDVDNDEKATVVAYVTDAITALNIGDYAKAADVTTQLSELQTALQTNIDTKADKTTVEELSGKVTNNETEISNIKTSLESKAESIDVEALQMTVSGVYSDVETLKTDVDKINTDLYDTSSDGISLVDKAISAYTSTGIMMPNVQTNTEKINTLETSVGSLDSRMLLSETDIITLKSNDKTHTARIADLTADLVAANTAISDLATIAETGNVNDLIQDEGDYIVFDCGSSTINI